MRLGLIPSDISSLKRKIVWSFRKKFHFKGDKEQSFKMRSSISYLYKIIPTVCCSLTYKRKRLNESTCWYDEANLHIRYSRAKMPRLITHSKLERAKKGISLKNRITFGFIGFPPWKFDYIHIFMRGFYDALWQTASHTRKWNEEETRRERNEKIGKVADEFIIIFFLTRKFSIFSLFFLLPPEPSTFTSNGMHDVWNISSFNIFFIGKLMRLSVAQWDFSSRRQQ